VLRRLAFAALVSASAAVAVPLVGAGSASASDTVRPAAPTALTVTVSGSGRAAAADTYELRCAPTGGTHPEAQSACDRLSDLAARGQDPFAPVPGGTMCTDIYGGPATARVTGSWRGRHVDASFNRANGCEISRWNALEPVLPEPSGSTEPSGSGR
jgi:Subtilisin inhibitor-like